MIVCEWFLLCANEASILVQHPVLGEVPTCTHCAEKLNLDGRSIDQEES